MLINKTDQNMSLNTKTYSKLLRETAKQNGVELLNGRWTDSPYAGRVIRDDKRKITFTINTSKGNFKQFIKELSIWTSLTNGTAPRYTAPKQHIKSVLVDNGGTSYWKREFTGNEFTYLRFNCEIA
jgi:hypothetical protein